MHLRESLAYAKDNKGKIVTNNHSVKFISCQYPMNDKDLAYTYLGVSFFYHYNGDSE